MTSLREIGELVSDLIFGIMQVMGRALRPVADDLVYHVLNRGNNRATVFGTSDDFRLFLAAVARTMRRYPFKLCAYCLMPNHFHFLLQPLPGTTISRLMQSLTTAHTRQHHERYGTVGHVWQGRFKSPVVEDDHHLLTVMRYIEANPVRAGLVGDAGEYPYSSYRAHGLGEVDGLLSPVPQWEALGRTREERCTAWKRIVGEPLFDDGLRSIRESLQANHPYGGRAWVVQVAERVGLSLDARPRGRPKKNQV